VGEHTSMLQHGSRQHRRLPPVATRLKVELLPSPDEASHHEDWFFIEKTFCEENKKCASDV
jgi:hypothetical protein